MNTDNRKIHTITCFASSGSRAKNGQRDKNLMSICETDFLPLRSALIAANWSAIPANWSAIPANWTAIPTSGVFKSDTELALWICAMKSVALSIWAVLLTLSLFKPDAFVIFASLYRSISTSASLFSIKWMANCEYHLQSNPFLPRNTHNGQETAT